VVYTREVDGKSLNFAVSGMLWNRSLVMVDKETGSLWSHLLGRAMRGPLKGTRLEAVPTTMVTWETWHREHPKTTLINLSRTAHSYVKEYYRRPADFVYGWIQDGQAYEANFAILLSKPVLNLHQEPSALVLTFDRPSTSANLFSRVVDGQTLQFVPTSDSRMKDAETESTWNSHTGVAIDGPLKGTKLEQRVGIVSFVRTWKVFHPDSQPVGLTD